MCLIVFAYRVHPRYDLIVAANRDEFYRRPTAPADFWEGCPRILAGRDLEQLGTWLGVTADGRFAALTNYRDPAANRPGAKSRGALVRDYLCGGDTPGDYLAGVRVARADYNGFNLLLGDGRELLYYSNRSDEIAAVAPGIHALSNHFLDTPWPKVIRAKAGMAACVAGPDEVATGRLFALLGDRSPVPDAELPETGVGVEWERILAPIFIVSPDYGTRSSTVVTMGKGDQVEFRERSYPDGGEKAYKFALKSLKS